MLLDECMVYDLGLPGRLCLIVRLDHTFAHAQNSRDVSAGLQLMILIRNFCCMTGHHRDRTLRINERHESLLDDRVECDDLCAAILGSLERMKKTRAVRAGILSEEKEGIRLRHVIPDDGTDRRPNNFCQTD